MNEAQAYNHGRNAQAEGLSSSVMQDPDMYEVLIEAEVGEATHLMRAWSRGWWSAFHEETDALIAAELER